MILRWQLAVGCILSSTLQCSVHSLAVGGLDLACAVAMNPEDWCFNLFGEVDRRYLSKLTIKAANLRFHYVVGAPELAVAAHELEHIADAVYADCALVKVGRFDDAHQGRVAAVAGADDTNLFRIRNARLDQGAGTVFDIVLHLFAPVLQPGLKKRVALAGGTTKIHL